MKIKIKHYPADKGIEFELYRPLPKFKYGCHVRTSILHAVCQFIKYEACHHPADFIVETVIPRKYGEEWLVGS